MNQCILSGNLGSDPTGFYANSGTKVVSFNLAFKSGKNGTGWIRISCFNKLAEIASEHLHKGAKVAVIGVLEQQKWQADDGTNRSGFQLIANSIEFIKVNGQGHKASEHDEEIPY